MGVGFGASSPIRRVVSHRLQSADNDRSSDERNRGGPADRGHSLTLL